MESVQPLPTPTTWQQNTPAQVGQTHQARQASRDDRFRQITCLRAQGLTQAQIAKRVGMSEKSVRTWLKRGAAPTCKRNFRRRSIFDPYAAYVLERWQQGVREGKQLYGEIQAQGFRGSIRVVQRFIQALQVPSHARPELPPASPADQFSANNAAWLFLREPEQLADEEQAELHLICQRSPTAETTHAMRNELLTSSEQS